MNTQAKPRKLSAQSARRRSVIISELSRLSRNGWAHAKPSDYAPLEAELAVLVGERS